jgi:hypothetical protein
VAVEDSEPHDREAGVCVQLLDVEPGSLQPAGEIVDGDRVAGAPGAWFSSWF